MHLNIHGALVLTNVAFKMLKTGKIYKFIATFRDGGCLIKNTFSFIKSVFGLP